MVFIIDDGSEFKATREKIWRYNQSESGHNHPSMQNAQVSQEGGSMLFTYETVSPNGSTEKRRTRVTPLPPLGSFVEEIEGRFAGSKVHQLLYPEG